MTLVALLAAVALVSGGQPRACLVVADDATRHERFIANEFSRWTKELTGAELPVGATAVAGMTPISFRLGDEDVQYDGFKLSVSNDNVVFSAKESVGLTYGVFWVLNRFGKIYWFNPSSGADFAPTDTFELPEGTILKTPMYSRIGMTAGRGDQSPTCVWNIRNGLREENNRQPSSIALDYGLPKTVIHGGHAYGSLVLNAPVDAAELQAEKNRLLSSGEAESNLVEVTSSTLTSYARYNILVKKYPWRFPLIDGVRSPTGSGMRGIFKNGLRAGNPCLSNPETRQFIYDSICADRAACRTGGEKVKYVWRMLCDDNSQWCECDECMKLIKGKGDSSADNRASDYWWDFVSYLAPKLLEDPDTSINVGIYLTYRQMPTVVPTNVINDVRVSGFLCLHGRCYLHPLFDEGCTHNAPYRKLFNDWKSTGIHIMMYEYHGELPGTAHYMPWEKSWVEDLRTYWDRDVSLSEGALFGPWNAYSSSAPQMWSGKACWLKSYLTAHFEWDPDDDFETARTDALTRYYRASAPEMTAFHKLLEGALYRADTCMYYGSSELELLEAAAEPGLLEQARRLLRAAEKKAALSGDAELVRRVAEDRFFFGLDWESVAARHGAGQARPLFRVQEDIALDGVLDEPSWAKATVADDWRLQGEADFDNVQTTAMTPHTAMRLAYDNTNLYVAVTCDKAAGASAEELRLSVLPPSLHAKCYNLTLPLAGDVVDALPSAADDYNLMTTSGVRHAILDEPSRWTAEVAIPMAQFPAPADGEIWRVCAQRSFDDGSGGRVVGTSTGFPIDCTDGMEGFSFGTAGTLVKNGSFEVGEPVSGLDGNGINWHFMQDEVPKDWTYHSNGGNLDWRTDDPVEGRRYMRLWTANPNGGGSFVCTPNLALVANTVSTYRISFAARGKASLQFYKFGLDALEHVPFYIESDGWKRYCLDLPLCGTRPAYITIAVSFPDNSPVDFDDFVIVPADGLPPLGNDFYVDPANGADDAAHDGTTWATAKRSLTEAMKLAQNGDTIHAAEGEYDTGAYGAKLSNEKFPATFRVGVFPGVTLVATGRAERTFIRGSGGACGTNSVACAYLLGAKSVIRGFTLADGRAYKKDTDHYLYGGGVYAGSGGKIVDCRVVGCKGYRGGAGYGGSWIRCRFENNAYEHIHSGVRFGSLYNCVVGAHKSYFAWDCNLYNCTVLPSCNVLMRDTDGGKYDIVNSLVLAKEISYGGGMFSNCVFGAKVKFSNSGWTTNACVVAASDGETAIDAESCEPATGTRMVDAADEALARFPSGYGETDVNGAPRVVGGRLDVGAAEWQGYKLKVGELPDGVAIDGVSVGQNLMREYPVAFTVRREPLPELGAAIFVVRTNGVAVAFGKSDEVRIVVPSADADITVEVPVIPGLYVDEKLGSDAGNGDGPGERAFATLQKAMDCAYYGETVYVAEGVYSNNVRHVEATAKLPAYDARVFVPSGVKLVATGRRSETVILGQKGTGAKNLVTGCVRCVVLEDADCLVKGFTIKNGHAPLDPASWNGSQYNNFHQGGGVAAEKGGYIVDCDIVGCRAYRGSAGSMGTWVRCYFTGNMLGQIGPGFYTSAKLYNCVIDSAVEDYFACNAMLVHCTFLESTVVQCPIRGLSSLCKMYNCLIRSKSVIQQTNGGGIVGRCAFLSSAYVAPGSCTNDCLYADSLDELALDAETYAPLKGTLAVDAADESLAAFPAGYGDTDFNGNPRVYNGKADIGAVEYDWRGDFGAALASATVTVVRATSGVMTNGVKGLTLTDGETVAFDWPLEVGGAAFGAEVSGGGVLTVRVNGNVISGRSFTVTEPGVYRVEISFAGEGRADVSDFRTTDGSFYMIR